MKQVDPGTLNGDAVHDGPVGSPRPARAEGVARGMLAGAAPTPKAVALVLFPALVLMLAFAFSYVGAFHEPTPHHVPLAVVGPPSVVAQLGALPGHPLDPRAT